MSIIEAILWSIIVILVMLWWLQCYRNERLRHAYNCLWSQHQELQARYTTSYRSGVQSGMRAKTLLLRDREGSLCDLKISGDLTECLACGLGWDTNDREPPGCRLKISKEQAV